VAPGSENFLTDACYHQRAVLMLTRWWRLCRDLNSLAVSGCFIVFFVSWIIQTVTWKCRKSRS